MEVCTTYPELYPYNVRFSEYSRLNITYLAHYSQRRKQKTNQWQDVQIQSGVKAELKIDWTLKNTKWLDLPRPFTFVNGGRTPMGRKDGFGMELLPDPVGFLRALSDQPGTTVYVGKGPRIHDVPCDIDLNDKCSLSDLMDVASLADRFFGQVSFIIPLAEVFDRELVCVWSEKGLKSKNWVINHLTPEKVLSKQSSMYAMDTDYL